MIVSLRPLRRVSLRAKRSNLFKEIASPFGLAMTLVVATPVILWAQSDVVSADRQALKEAQEGSSPSKILAAKEQLSDDLAAQAERKREDAKGINIPLVADSTGHFFVDVVLNNNVHASLIVDTGAPVVLLSSRFIRLLDLDAATAKKGYVSVLNGKYKAAEILLNSLQLGDAQGTDITAAVLLEDNKEIESAFKDGLLGLSFLNKYHFTLDQEGQRLILRKPE